MARKYAKLYVEVWDAGSDFRDLTAAGQRLYWLLCSLPQLSAAGVLPLQPKKWARLASDTTEGDIDRALAELEIAGKVLVDADTDEVLIRAFIRRDGGIRTPNIEKSVWRAIDAIESNRLRRVTERELQRAAELLSVTLSRTLPQTLGETLSSDLSEGQSYRTSPEDLRPTPTTEDETSSPTHEVTKGAATPVDISAATAQLAARFQA